MKHKYIDKTVIKLYSEIENYFDPNDLKWLNLGYWKNATNYNEACERLIDLVAEYSQIKNGEVILDAGIGYGEQDFQLLKKFESLKIYGLNIVLKQIEYAIQKSISLDLSNNFCPLLQNASDLLFRDCFFDKVISIEAAFHFNTRELFLLESYRVLKKEGILCVVDCIPFSGEIIKNYDDFENIGIPIENLYGIDEYVSLLEKIGFREIEFTDLSMEVLPYFLELNNHGHWRNKKNIKLNKLQKENLLIEWKEKHFSQFGFHKYIIIKARK